MNLTRGLAIFTFDTAGPLVFHHMRITNLSLLTAEELAKTSSITLRHYNETADSFWAGTRDHDVSQNRDALLEHLQGPKPYRILDFGCGPGRDLKEFKTLGHEAIGLEGAQRFVELAREYSGCAVWHQDFLRLELPAEFFHGIFANASLFHVPSQELIRVLKELHGSLKSNGVLFSSNPRGENEEGWSGQRYGVYYNLERWREMVTAAGFFEITHYYRPPGLPREQQPWLASLWRKIA
ncbi:MAG TPA: class I SAM-dependent methyltransferase [Candidatus Acidoferrales bacterium]|nr:class I SAM-dependent methyltransferase [Candidatus Acidoferrales bacterium]